jgi:crotonobetainyl-CoA:carnitine CoA-transferase CaiB-like acyl-CoA transferase
MDERPLEGVRVLEIGGGIAAAFAARWMAGFGADVVRSEGPPGLLTADEEVYLLAGKRRVAAAGDALCGLARVADIIVEDGPPGVLAAQGLDPTALRAERPALVLVSITPFGQAGPYREFSATNLVAHAMGGILSLTGTPDRPPLVNGGSQAYYAGGLNGFAAALTAYFGALVHGEGDWVDISLQECAAAMLELYGPRTEAATGTPAIRLGNHTSAVWGIYPVLDGYGGVCCLARQIPAFFSVVGDPELLEPRFTDPMQRLANNDELGARLYAWFATKTKQELLELGPKHNVPFGAVVTPRELLDNASLAERGFFDRVETPEGVARIPGRPFLGLTWAAGGLSAPAADTEAVLREWGVAP